MEFIWMVGMVDTNLETNEAFRNGFLFGWRWRTAAHQCGKWWSAKFMGNLHSSEIQFQFTQFSFNNLTLQWHSPDELLRLNKSGKIWLPAPQLYELARLNSESNIDKLVSFAKTRGQNSPTTLIFPIHFQTSDGLIHCYPGDDFYPKDPDYNKTTHNLEQYATKTCAECRAMATNLHRAELKSINDVEIWQNIGNFDNHLSPDTTTNDPPVTSKL